MFILTNSYNLFYGPFANEIEAAKMAYKFTKPFIKASDKENKIKEIVNQYTLVELNGKRPSSRYSKHYFLNLISKHFESFVAENNLPKQFVFRFANEQEVEDYRTDFIWITEKEYWEINGFISDEERGIFFPDEVKNCLSNIMEGAFEWDTKKFTREEIREILIQNGFEEIQK